MNPSMVCPLCDAALPDGDAPGEASRPAPWRSAHGWDYFRCSRCDLVFRDPETWPTPEAERARYDTHRNHPDDPAYRSFLGRLVDPLLDRILPGERGLDYGSGPGPALAAMLEEAGFPMAVWDPFYAPDPSALDGVYDFVTCTETVEHFHRPGREFRRLQALLRPGGWLGVMTGILHPEVQLETWRYARDITHVALYSPGCLAWIGDHFGWEAHFPAPDVILFGKPPTPPTTTDLSG